MRHLIWQVTSIDLIQDGWSPWSPQASYDRRRHRNCFPTRKSASISEKVNISWGHRSVDALFTCVDLHVLVSRSINMLSVTDFVPKGIISGVRVQAGLLSDMLDADRSPNNLCSQRSCRNFTGGFRSWLPATCMLVHQEIFWSPW